VTFGSLKQVTIVDNLSGDAVQFTAADIDAAAKLEREKLQKHVSTPGR
jgi:hypothetical protein